MKFNKEYKTNVKIKEKKHDIAMLKEMRRQKGELQRRYRAKQKTKTNKQTNKRRKPVHPIKEMNEKLK